ncbi:hypothetical protein QE152_g20766 [Popillia japonica]|uniref:Uncharacterized protein n=1 Tax=Popillia japonica TaxID=7064 RepID=A0AAW1KPK2_POPJA
MSVACGDCEMIFCFCEKSITYHRSLDNGQGMACGDCEMIFCFCEKSITYHRSLDNGQGTGFVKLTPPPRPTTEMDLRCEEQMPAKTPTPGK